MSRSAELAAPAKVNLVLRVLHGRADGYHEIETLFQAIDLLDDVRVERVGSGIQLDVHGAHLGPLEQNLAYRAAAALRDRFGLAEGMRISLTKRIPAGAGLGGGSSDGAAVLRCLAALLGLEGDERVTEIGAELGSDVPFFLGSSPLSWGRGRGEVLDPLTSLPPADMVLISPPVHVSTAEAYRALDASRRGSSGSAEASDAIDDVPNEPLDSWRALARQACNDFQDVMSRAHPEIARSLVALQQAGATLSLLSGSGSTCFGLFEDAAGARGAAARLQHALGWPCRPVRTLRAFPRP